jgi:hypothetical protein
VEPKPVIEYNLDVDEEVVIFGEAEMTVKEARILGVKGLEQMRATEIIKIRYPKVVATKDAVHGLRIIKGTITFLNERGIITNRISVRGVMRFTENGKDKWINEECYLSSNGEYVGIINTFSRIPEKTEKTNFCLMDKNGNVLWEKESMQHEINKCIISGNGNRILMVDHISPVGEDPVRSGFYLYDRKGRQLWKQEINEDIFNVVMSKNSKYLAANISVYTGVGSPPFEDYLFFYNIDEKKSWKYKVKIRGYISLSETGEVTVKNDEYIYTFTKDGKLKEKRRR